MGIPRITGFFLDKPLGKPIVEAKELVDFRVQLVRLANTRYYVDVLDYLRVLPSVPEKKINANDAEKFFSVVLHRDDFDSQDKYDILILSFYRGYEEQSLLLLTQPLLIAMLEHPRLSSIVLLCYQYAIQNDKVAEINDNLPAIWQVLLVVKEDYFWIIIRDILKYQNSSSGAHFIAILLFWLKTMTDLDQIRRGILKLKDIMESAAKINLVPEDILQLGRIRIYELFLFKTKPMILNDGIKEFLGIPRTKESIFSRRFGKSENLLNLIIRNPTSAQAKLNEVRQEIADKVFNRNNIAILVK